MRVYFVCGWTRWGARTVLQFASLDDRYTHYFKSGCHPTCPDIRVQSIDDKCAEYISEAKAALSLDEFDFRFLLVLLASDWWLEGSRLCVRLI